MLNRASYIPEISEGVLVEMTEHRKHLEKKTKPMLDTLRSYQDLPPDKALAIEDKKRRCADAEKYLEDVLHSALASLVAMPTLHFLTIIFTLCCTLCFIYNQVQVLDLFVLLLRIYSYR
ncbi:AUGMIN subunit 1-like isoform X2 [Primulina huaijiensis]|uniref:AUGMIN subunit 1-like isoform X2 n=1 Tax=Primulina huaijiensis TaxID=1492673 RepID=UPI003CC6E6BC